MSEELPIQETEASIATGTNRLDTVSERRAKRVLDRVQRGDSLSDAASAERLRVRDLKDPDNAVGASVRQLIGQYFLPPEARKQLVRAGLNKIFLDNVDSENSGDQKVALEAAKQISLDPEVGLQQDLGGGVIINIGELAGVFEQIKQAKAPVISDGRQGANRIVEAEYEDVTDGGSESPPVSDVLGGHEPGDAA